MAFGDLFSGVGDAITEVGDPKKPRWLPRKWAWCRAKILAKKRVTNNVSSKARELDVKAPIDEIDQNEMVD